MASESQSVAFGRHLSRGKKERRQQQQQQQQKQPKNNNKLVSGKNDRSDVDVYTVPIRGSDSAEHIEVEEQHTRDFPFQNFKEDPIPYRLQGDKRMYTKKALAQREALSENPNVTKSIQRIWNAIPKHNGTLDQKHYMMFFMRVCKLLNPDMDFDTAARTVQSDFERDTKGNALKCLDESSFQKAMFELVDIWTLDISVEEYVTFLELLLDRMS
mmetsp:Transcript_19397/g.34635  ORF Transcript_19397/g.34635 Transcript_19397/m.34635 type:complete len:214 (+) Transcript_19397:183-824(+)|eukprot:CAMPEP_0197524462 /NCGR_PEP_ID=MMETSP1318-20131121/9136_1 /TAXON_ID=552666 /ORGANISM="Partenskyella glossopodia, Strain RCC365" /LENGTH=213 /DNA_ID=CAMNT_0043077431 /DNA_START=142 /DNA_END=783 /DNA_ORIENTATION=+